MFRRPGRRSLRLSLTGPLLLVSFLAAPALGLDPRKAIAQYIQEIWQTEQGLPQNSVNAIAQTSDGYLWFGTEEGLARFDGVRFTLFDKGNTPELEAPRIRALYGDREGNLWISAQGGGLIRFRDGTFTTFTTKDGLAEGVVTSICEDREGNLWVGTWRGLSRFRNGTFTVFTTKAGLAEGVVTSICEDREGNVWIGTYGGGLNRFRDGTFTAFTTKDGLTADRVNRICEDREGSLWIGTDGGGLSRLTNGRFTSFTTKDGLSFDTIRSVYLDREGSLWIGTYGGGLNRFRDGKFTTFTKVEGLLDDSVSLVYEDREGSLWIATRGGVSRLRDGTFTSFTTKEGLSHGQVASICGDREGSLWVGTQGGGLSRLRGGAFTTFTTKDGLSDDNVISIYEDREGDLWIGTWGGLNRFRRGTLTAFTTRDGPAPEGPVLSIDEDREGSLWIGTQAEGLIRLKDGTFTAFTTKDGLPSDTVFTAHSDGEGSVWIGSPEGLSRLRDGTFTAFTAKQGLADGNVYQILDDGQDNLWMSCNKGILRVSKKGLDALAEGRLTRVSCEVYGSADGMKSPECNGYGQPAGWRTRDGRLWFPTTKGAVVIDPAHMPVNTLPPPVVMEEVLVDGKLLERPAAGSPVVLAPGTQRLEIHYTANSFLVPKRVKFKVRLDGFDKDWVDAGTERTAHYTNLPPRKYTFRVIACNDDGVWNSTGASFAFSLRPHFYQTWWWYLLCALGVAGVGAAVYVARVRQLKARERQLVRLVEEKTRDLQGANAKLLEAQEKISRLLESSPGASEGIPEWSRAVAAEIAAAIGARAIGIWELDRDSVTPVSDSGLSPPSREELEGALAATGQGFVDSDQGRIVPVTGMSGELCGALLVPGKDLAWGDTERRLLAGFAHQLGGMLELSRMRRKLAVAEERRALTRRELHERGIATLQICPRCGRCYDHTAASCAQDGASLESPRPLPYLLLGRYRFLQVLGQGGMGVVLSAHDEKLGREIAVKLIKPEHWSNVALKQRFEREARAVARIQHPGVVELHDSGELEDGTAFLVMEKLAGCDLRLLLKTHGRGRPSQVAQLVRQGCAALRAAHRAGVVHRDLKPENVFLVDDPSGFRVKILDFGLAKSMAFEKGLTQTGMILGTPSYMAPEQVQGEDVDTRADVYSFAAVAFEALTGRQAIRGNDRGAVFIQVLNAVPPAISSLVPGIPPEVDAAFESGLAKAAARRLKDIELWGSSFVELLEKVPGDPAAPGWPVARNVFTQLRDSQFLPPTKQPPPGVTVTAVEVGNL